MKRRLAVWLSLLALVLAVPVLRAAAPGSAKAEKEEPVIPGITIERRTDGRLLGLELVSGNFKLTFYDRDKKAVKADFPRVLMRWDVVYKNAQERVILTPAGDGTYVTSPRIIRPPHNFQLFITLIADANDRDSETYVIRFTQ